MPIYEYQCGDCRHQFERRQRFDEEPVAMCPRCGGKSRRVIHAAPIIFKGPGFYVTDNRKASRPAGMPEKPPTPTTDKMLKDISAAERKLSTSKD